MTNNHMEKIFNTGLRFHHYTNTAYPLTPWSLKNYELHNKKDILKTVTKNIADMEELSLYVHIPFCKARCKFCEYVVLDKPNEGDEDRYVEALLKEISMYRDIIGDKPIVGYDLGGGTPAFISAQNIKRITEEINKFNLQPGMIKSVETTPLIAATDLEKIRFLKEIGYERISMGFQTVSEKLLETLGREGSASIYEKAVANIRAAGYTRLNIDLMYGFLNQSDEDFLNTVKYTIAMEPEYVTLYRNRYKGTKLEGESLGVTIYKVDTQYNLAFKALTEAGYEARIGKNTFSKIPGDLGTSDYLTRRVVNATSYVGFGLGAQSFVGNYLAYNKGCDSKRLDKYISDTEKGFLPINDIALMPTDEVLAKAVSVMFYFGAINLKAFSKRFNGAKFEDIYKQQIEYLTRNGLMEFQEKNFQEDDAVFALTEKGALNIYGIIPLFYSSRSLDEMFALAETKVDDAKGESIWLGKYNRKEYAAPSVAVDLVVFNKERTKVLTVVRSEHPEVNKVSLPGGMFRPDDKSIETAAVRIALTKLGITIGTDSLLLNCVQSEQSRDSRGWIISVSFICQIEEDCVITAGGNAIKAEWSLLKNLDHKELAFDHSTILAKALSHGE